MISNTSSRVVSLPLLALSAAEHDTFSKTIDLWTEEVFIQKLNYIHNNPVNYPWNLVQHPEEYKYSSAKFYETVLMNLDY